MEKRIVKAHDEVRTMKVIRHYEDHAERSESAEFRRAKHDLHAKGAECYIDNGFCEGQLEVHHNVIEYSASTEVDWAKVKRDFPNVDSVDDVDQMLVICKKHHTGRFHGIHEMDYPTWVLQRYMTRKALLALEEKVAALKAADQAE